jgi:hypothetical protein
MKRERLDVARRSPGMYGLRTYSEVVSFLLGYDAALDDQLFDGFEAWLLQNRLDSAEDLRNVAWPSLILSAAYPDQSRQLLWSSLARTWDEHAVNVLWDCIEGFLDQREGQELGYRERRVLNMLPATFTASISRIDLSLLAVAEDCVDALHTWGVYRPESTVNDSRTESLLAHWSALKARDRVELMIGEFPDELRSQIRHFLTSLDSEYQAKTVADDEQELSAYHPADGTKRWWWTRIPPMKS